MSEIDAALFDDFAGTAFWSPSLARTDEPGVYAATFTLPKKSGTWKVRAWAMGLGTRVGEGVCEIETKE